MNPHILFRLCFLLPGCVLAGRLTAQTQVTDTGIVAMGHDAWIRQNRHGEEPDPARLLDAEKRYASVLAVVKDQNVMRNPDHNRLQDLDVLMANITKGACRLTDYKVWRTPLELLMSAKATTVMVTSMNAIALQTPTKDMVTQADVWSCFREVSTQLQYQRKEIETYHRAVGGYDAQQHMLEFRALGPLAKRTFQLMSDASDVQKKHLFRYCVRMFKMTVGEDPLPY